MGNQTKRVNVHDLKLTALELRKQGKSYRQIAIAIGRSKGLAHRWVGEMLLETLQEPANELRTLELERLDALSDALWPLIVKEMPDDVADEDRADYRPSLKAVDSILRVMERRAKLLGLDAPVRTEHSGSVDVRTLTDDELRAIVEGRG